MGKGTKVYLGAYTCRHRCVMGEWFHGLLKCTLGHGKVHCNYKINDQLVHEWVTASLCNNI